jgi:hypothetical protein
MWNSKCKQIQVPECFRQQADQTKERGEIASKKAWEYGKTGFKDVSERNPKIGKKKGNRRVKKVTGR